MTKRFSGVQSRFLQSLIAVAFLAAACGQTSGGASKDLALQSVAGHKLVRSCGDSMPGFARCHAIASLPTNAAGELVAAAVPGGLNPADLISAYAVPATGGTGQTIAIVDAMDDPNAESDLATYRSQFGLPPCTTANGCFRKVSQTGTTAYPAGDVGWAEEISLDLDMASAICPNCKILLVEANSPSINDLGTAVNRAALLGASVISNSYGGGESTSDPSTTASFYNHPGILITASTGDNGFGIEYPAAATTVLAVGGTHLVRSATSRGWTETVWGGAGSGCSAVETKPSWQTDTGCARRTVGDASAVADPATGVSVYDSFGLGGWAVFGGTSVASPIIASIFALTGRAGATPQYPYTNPGQFNDVVGGSNGTCSPSYLCTGVAGYDGPTGLGTPNASAMAAAGACGEPSCVASQGQYVSHYTGPNCTGTESYYTPYFTGGTTGVPGNCQPAGSAGKVCGTQLHTVTNVSAITQGGTCSNLWPSGNTLSGFVTVYGKCGEAGCVNPQASYTSHFTGPNCTGTESYYTPYFTGGSTGVSGNCQPNNSAGAVCGTQLKTVTNISAITQGGTCANLWPMGNTLTGFVTVYR
jgi:subtilase family serine protease